MALRICNLEKRYDKVVALDKVSIDVQSGELVTVVGPSGCGKSTLLKIIAGFLHPEGGSVEIDGKVVNDLPIRERGIAYVMEKLGLYPHLSVFENVAYPLRVRRVAGGELMRRVLSVCEMTGIGGLEERRPSELSGGQRQRVAVARALVRDDARVLLADECFSDLDAQLRYQLRGEFRVWQRKRQLTCLFVTHDQEEALALGDRVAVMKAGGFEQVGVPADVYHDPQTLFVASFLGRPSVNIVPVLEADGQLSEIGRLSGCAEPRFGRLPSPDWVVGFRPEDVEVLPVGNAGVAASVESIETMSPDTLVHLLVSGRHRVVARIRTVGSLPAGEAVCLKIQESRCHLFDRKSGIRLAKQR